MHPGQWRDPQGLLHGTLLVMQMFVLPDPKTFAILAGQGEQRGGCHSARDPMCAALEMEKEERRPELCFLLPQKMLELHAEG